MKKERINEIWGVLFLLLGLFSLTSLVFFHPEDIPFFTSLPALPVHNVTGVTGAYLAFVLLATFGISSLMIPAIFLLWSGCFFLQKVPEKKLFKFVGLAIALFSTSTLIAISIDPVTRLEKAGAVGYLVGNHLLRYFGYVGSFILASSCLLLSILLATDFLIYPLVKNIAAKFQKTFSGIFETIEKIQERFSIQTHVLQEQVEKVIRKTPKLTKIVTAAPQPQLPPMPLKVKQYRPDIEEAAEEIKKEEAAKAVSRPVREVKPRPDKTETSPAAAGEESRFEGVISSKKVREGAYVFPSIDLLRKSQREAIKTDNLQGNSKILEETLADFGIEVKVMEVEQGPVITRYELMPAPGVKVNSIAALSDDLALALKATSIRLIIPIPGKSAIGIEVPNSITSVVYLRELIESGAFRSKKCALPLALGKDTSGKPLVADLAAMPHILIAGTTGSGKTVCVNSIITALLYYSSPEDLKFVMVDPKMVELAIYNKIPHMLAPVVTDVRKAAHTLNWVVNEMENRYKLFATVGVRNIQAFNTRPLSEEAAAQLQDAPPSENVVPSRLPYIVLVIDELADLMMVAQDKVEGAITRLAQLSRAVGIHLILATQRPSVDVITGVIKANFPARIS
ncbi:MAG: DNA translocase FtsK 4TM domain-containing protein, partial [Candidatus Omnitrophica bacterium]|nr:DNA translocase FtsK 4TM domain-containing protein [Candidatus Omnitrophota bacterium]